MAAELQKQLPTHQDLTKIVEISADRIRLYSRPPWWLVALFGTLFCALLFGLCPSHELACRQTVPHTVDLRVKRRLLGFTLSERTIAGVTGAEVQGSSEERGGINHGVLRRRGTRLEHNGTARIVFATQSGPVPLVETSTIGRDGFQDAVDELNRILESNRPVDRAVRVPTSGWIWLTTVVIGLIGVTLIPGGSCRCVVDRTENRVRFTWPTFLGMRHKEFALTDVESFRVVNRYAPVAVKESEEQPQRVQDLVDVFRNFRRLEQRSFTHSIGVRLHNGEEFSITRQSGAVSKPSAEDLIQLLERFRRGEL